jgi:ring-1,2-phenylacetyl-CoA epoxidase subunit PaaE
MPEFHTLVVKDLINETSDAVSVHFDIPLDIQDKYRYKPGQYLTLKLTLDGEELRRAYSLCSSPYVDSTPAIAVKKVAGGRMSNYINEQLRIGDKVEVMTPLGNFTTELNEFYSRHFVLFAGGSGITPIFSIMKSVLHAEPTSRVSLVYGNKDQGSIIFHDELFALEGQFADRCQVVHCLENPPTGWNGASGKLTPETAKELLHSLECNVKQAIHFICGPTPMMANVRQALEQIGVSKDSIHIEYFTAKSEGLSVPPPPPEAATFSGKAAVTVELHGDTYHIQVDQKQTILGAGLEAGIDPPFACQMGICTTCRAKLLEGTVHMDETEGLTNDELDQNYILTCQAHPRSPVIKVRYE